GFVGGLDLGARRVALRSLGGAAHCVIDLQNTSRGFHGTNETPQSIIDGFTIVHGNAPFGGGMYMIAASPTVMNCIFRENTAEQSGGAVLMQYSSPLYVNCSFFGNSSSVGAVLITFRSFPTFVNCTFALNSGGAGPLFSGYEGDAQ